MVQEPLGQLRFRAFAGKADFPKMAKLLQDIATTYNAEFWTTPEDIERDYQHLSNSTPETDMLMVEAEDERLVAYVRAGWDLDDDGRQVFNFPFNIHPQYRDLPLLVRLLQWVEARSREIARATQAAPAHILRAFLRNGDQDVALQEALETQSFKPVRFMNRMVRDLHEPIEVPPLPAGLEVRAVEETQYRQVLLALDEAFQDHWGHAPFQEAHYQSFVSSPMFKPVLWQVAWEGSEVAAGVLNTVDDEANQQFNLKRGLTDPIFTRRPWRKRGLARALLMRSLQAFQEMGMDEAMLGVDTQNPNQAFVLYESCGFRPVMRSIIYEKELTPNPD